ncbi:HlyC/CorC family transporter [Kandleria vitulina]|uniref:HlyC/CorC family transporter n=1 Tax=Kandleria vitulina TaxID=1630 RepID=UPI00048E72FE|nr:hemolysin family protein [Kandleria vitulina]MEE0988090.1 hemolysin family protein [Kandleria vitulina]
MEPSQTIMIVAFLILIMLSAFFSSAETSFMAVSKIRIKTLAEEENSRRAQLVQKLLDNNEQLLSTILVGNNLVNIAASSLTTSFVISIFGNEGIGVALATGFVTLMILIFGEITPKTLASNNAEKFVLAFAPIISFFRIVFMPIVFILNVFTHIMMKAFGDLSSTGPTVTQEDLKTIVNVSHEEGVLEDDERKMLHNIFAFGETEIKEIMTPRIHVEDVKDDISYDELIDFLKNCQFSRIPVYRNEDSDDIVGVLNIKDLLLADVDQEQFDIKNYMREPYFVYEFNQISDVFESMRKDHVTLAVVLDEYGVMSGIVSLEDIVEEIVGEIDDEYDQEDDDVVALADNQFLLDGSLDIDEVNEECGTSFESEEFESIGGLVLGAVGGVPEINQKVVIDNGLFVIEKIEKNRIETLRLTVIEDEKQDT